MFDYLQALLLMVIPHPWNLHQRIGYGKIRFWLIEKYNNMYHEMNDQVIRWRERQIKLHNRMIREQDQDWKLIKDRDRACKNDVDPMSREYPDLLFYRKW
jgi:hypothetical protein